MFVKRTVPAVLSMLLALSTVSLAFAQDDVITLNYWRPAGGSTPGGEVPALWDDGGELLTQWANEHPNIKININSIPFGQLDTTELTALRAGSSDIDVLLVNHVTIGAAVGTGGLEPLDSCIESQTSVVPEDWISGLYAYGQFNGQQYTLPFDTDTRVMFYNKALLEEAGVEVPSTWDDLYAAFDAIEALDNGASPYYFPGLNKWYVLYHSIGPWLVQMNTSFLNPDGTASTALEPTTIEAFDHAVKLGKYAPDAALTYDATELESLFTQNRVGFFFNGIWSIPAITELTDGEWNLGDEYGIALIPGPEAGQTGSTNGGFHIAIAAASQHKDAACEFVAWATSPEVMAVATRDHIPTRISAQQSDYFQELAAGDEGIQLSLEQSEFGKPPVAPVVELPELADLVLEAFNLAVVGDLTAEEALQDLDQQIVDILSRR